MGDGDALAGLYSKQASRAANSPESRGRSSTKAQTDSSACLFACGRDACFHHQQSHRMLFSRAVVLIARPPVPENQPHLAVFTRAVILGERYPSREEDACARGAVTTTATALCGDESDPSVGGSRSRRSWTMDARDRPCKMETCSASQSTPKYEPANEKRSEATRPVRGQTSVLHRHPAATAEIAVTSTEGS
jgi:hypothetical protein